MTASRSRLCERAVAACSPGCASLPSGDMAHTVVDGAHNPGRSGRVRSQDVYVQTARNQARPARARRRGDPDPDLLHSVTWCSRPGPASGIPCADDDPGAGRRGDVARSSATLRQPRDQAQRPAGADASATDRPHGQEFQLLLALAERRNRVVPRADLYELVWRRRMAYRDRSVDVFVRKLRLKLHDAAPDGSTSTPTSASATGSRPSASASGRRGSYAALQRRRYPGARRSARTLAASGPGTRERGGLFYSVGRGIRSSTARGEQGNDEETIFTLSDRSIGPRRARAGRLRLVDEELLLPLLSVPADRHPPPRARSRALRRHPRVAELAAAEHPTVSQFPPAQRAHAPAARLKGGFERPARRRDGHVHAGKRPVRVCPEHQLRGVRVRPDGPVPRSQPEQPGAGAVPRPGRSDRRSRRSTAASRTAGRAESRRSTRPICPSRKGHLHARCR